MAGDGLGASAGERLGDAPELADVLAFLARIGVPVRAATLTDPTVLPGMTVAQGTLFYDPAQTGHVGDLLHEAGHIAVTDPAERAGKPAIEDDPAEEMATLAWSYAAAQAIGMPVRRLFHADYKAGSDCLVDAFSNGSPIGLPMLQYWGMAARADEEAPPFPAMRHWLRPPNPS